MKSCAALARRAKLSVNYVSMLERGDRRPRWETATTLAKALNLDDAGTAHFFRLIDAGGKPESVRKATSSEPLPIGSVWRNVPALVLSVAERPLDNVDADEAIGNGVPVLASAAAWARITIDGVPSASIDPMRKRAQAYHDRMLLRAGISGGTIYPLLLFAFGVLLKNDLFGTPNSARKNIRLIESWNYYAPRIYLTIAPIPPSNAPIRWDDVDPQDARKLLDYCIGSKLLAASGLESKRWDVMRDPDMVFALPDFESACIALASDRKWPDTDSRVIGYTKPINVMAVQRKLSVMFMAYDLGVGEQLLGWSRAEFGRRADAWGDFVHAHTEGRLPKHPEASP